MKVGVIIPAYNESDRIQTTIRSIRLLPGIHEIVVVDDGSIDETGSVALREGARVVWHNKNFGKGQALKTGFQSIQSEIVILLDADIGEKALELPKLIEPVATGRADMSIAVFPPVTQKQGFGLVKKLSVWGIQRLTGVKVEAPLSGQRVLSKKVIERLNLADGYGAEVAMTIDALRNGYRIIEVPVDMKNREYGRTIKGFLHRGRQFIHVARVLLERWSENDIMSVEVSDQIEVEK